MTEGPAGSPPRESRDLALVVGAALIIVGLWMFAGRVPFFVPVLDVLREVRRFGWPLLLVAGGAAVILYAQRPGARLPARGTRLYRSRSKRMIAGVLGGVSDYFGIDVTVLRLAYVALALMLGGGPAIVAYIAAAVVVPEEPAGPVPGPPPSQL